MRLFERTFRILAPHSCLLCGKEGGLICRWCRADACPPLPSLCYHCQKLSPDSRVCERCRPRTPLRHVWMRTNYEETAKLLVQELKFGRNTAAAEIIAELINEILPFLPVDTIIVHVPTNSYHVRQRGYDQSKLIASHLAKARSRSHWSLLGRLGHATQIGSPRQVRLVQLRDAFRPLKTELIKGSHILLVDDVLTTGGTLESAARALKKAGARQVNGVVFARSL